MTRFRYVRETIICAQFYFDIYVDPFMIVTIKSKLPMEVKITLYRRNCGSIMSIFNVS